MGSLEGHGFEKDPPVLHTIEFPTLVQVGQTVSIPYTFSWHYPNGTATFDEDDVDNIENIVSNLRVFIPEEFTIF